MGAYEKTHSWNYVSILAKENLEFKLMILSISVFAYSYEVACPYDYVAI